MPTRSRPRKNQTVSRKFQRVLAGCLVILAAIALLTAALRFRSNSPEPQIESFTADAGADDEFALEERFEIANANFDRRDYRYSVIPRGAYTEAELRTAIRTDPVVAAHYQHLDQSKLRTEVVARDRYVYVSYRKGNEIFWTKKKLLLRQGETIVSDGTTHVRARCGNCISEEPQLPTSEDEPDEIEFDRLVDAVPASVAPQVAVVQPVAPSTTAGEVAARGSLTSGSPATRSFVPGSVAGGSVAGGSVAGGSAAGNPPSPVAASQFGARAATPLVPSEHGPTPGEASSSPNSGADSEASPPSSLDFPGLPPSDPLNPFAPPDELLRNSPYVPRADDVIPPLNDVPPPGSPGQPANPTPVPEPGTIFLIGGGLAELIRRTMRTRKR